MRSIKTLGIATAMALALVAFAGAGSASANTFKAAVAPEKMSGELSGAKHSLTIGGEFSSVFYCSGVAFSGETKANTVSSLTVSPSLSGCEHAAQTNTAWKMNGCKFRFNAGPGPALSGTMDIAGCEKPMRYETVGTPCFVEIGNQNGLGKVEYQNITVGGVASVKVIAKLAGIKYTSNDAGCTGAPNGTFSDGTYWGDWILKGATIPGGAAAGVEFRAGTVASPRFAAEEGPATLSGIKSGGISTAFNFPTANPSTNNGQVWCESIAYSGTAALVPTETISLAPVFHGCFVVTFTEGKEGFIPILDKDITAGACSYELQAKGGFAVVGTGCAASPIKITMPSCVLKVGPQGGFPGPTFQNKGSGTLRTVTVINGETKGLTYTAEGVGCPAPGTFATAAPKPASVISAKDPNGAAQGFWVE